jgi:predicted lipoprotein with Yx(FWY)xxD motif
MKKMIAVAAILLVVAAAAVAWWQMSKRPSVQPTPAVNTSSSVTPPAAVIPPSPATTSAPEVTTVVLKNDPKLGSYLADNNGRALYYFAKDADGQSACQGGCIKAWPVFYLATVAIGPGLDMGDFRSITRADGTIQTTYYNWPLYYFSGDTAAGDVKGEGVNRLWSVAKPDYTVLFANKDNINYLIDADTGLTLYQFSKDATDVSNCSGSCVQNWPVFNVDKIVAPSFVDTTGFGHIVREDKNAQTTFKHLPLYLYVQDKVMGDMKGQGFGGFWSTVDPLGSSAVK